MAKGDKFRAVCEQPLGALVQGREYQLLSKGGNPEWVEVFEGGRQLCKAYRWRFGCATA